jgi:hypothetical protein
MALSSRGFRLGVRGCSVAPLGKVYSRLAMSGNERLRLDVVSATHSIGDVGGVRG